MLHIKYYKSKSVRILVGIFHDNACQNFMIKRFEMQLDEVFKSRVSETAIHIVISGRGCRLGVS